MSGPSPEEIARQKKLHEEQALAAQRATWQADEFARQMRQGELDQKTAQYQAEWEREAEKFGFVRNQLIAEGAKQNDTSYLKGELQQLQQKQQAWLLTNAKQQFEPRDPWRVINGKTNHAKGEGWVMITGRVLEVQPDGVRILGALSPPLEEPTFEGEFFVSSFPQLVADNETISAEAKITAFYDTGKPLHTFTNQFHTINGGIHTLRALNYGIVCAPNARRDLSRQQPILFGGSGFEQQIAATKTSIEQKEQAQVLVVKSAEQDFIKNIAELPVKIKERRAEQLAKQKQAQTAKTIAWQQELADKGSSYGQVSLGKRYLNCDGVGKDEIKARLYLQAAADQDDKEAKDLLDKLPVKIPRQSK